MASLVTTEGTSFELAEAETLVGRGGREYNDPPKVDVGPLQGGPTVSRRHARIFRRSGGWYLQVESEARNPTLVGGRRIPGGEVAPLGEEAHIQLGDVVLVFRAPREAVLAGPDMTIAEPPTMPPPAPAPEPLPVAPPNQPRPVETMEMPADPPAPTPVAPAVPIAPAVPPVQPGTSAWAARLPGRPTALGAVGVGELKRVYPFRGLMIDEEAWADAHDYHRLQDRLHLLSTHGWGIVEGLEVVADSQAPNVIVIRPGIAVDPQGRLVLVAQERRLAVSAVSGATYYLALRLREELTAPQRFWNDLDEYTRIVEKAEASLQTTPPASPAMELARFTVDGPVRDAGDPAAPRSGELDLRFRERLAVRTRPEIAVAQLVGAGGNGSHASADHRLGLRYLLREIGLTTPYRARWAGTVRPGEPIPAVSLLYVSGAGGLAFVGDGLDRLRAFLAAGGVLFADGCRSGGAAEMAAALNALASSLGQSLQPVGRWHPLLASRHIFGEAPLLFQQDATLVEGGGIILSTVDFGCAWAGGSAEKAVPRAVTREALEFGVNVAVFARQRQRPLDILELEG